MSPHASVLTATPETTEQRRALLDELKRRGRACVGSKDYLNGETLYGKGIEILSTVLDGDDDVSKADAKKDIAIFYSNRSLCRLQMNRSSEALEDADEAVINDPSYVKAHWRRGQAATACENLCLAVDAYRSALKLDPSNKALTKEVKASEKRKVEAERLLAEAAAAEAEEGRDEAAAESKKVTVVDKTNGKGETKKDQNKLSTSTAATVSEEDVSVFSKSDHVRGYKIRSDGKKTSYFDNELDENTKKLIGDITPKMIDPNAKQSKQVQDGSSAWNTAGTWEEKDVSDWAKEALQGLLLSCKYVLPEGSPSPGSLALVSKVATLEGHASYATVRGKKRYIYEFSVIVKWTLTLGDEQASGQMTFPDVDGTCELGGGYDLVDWIVDSGTPPGTGPLLDRFVRDAGLRDIIHQKIDEFVVLFRESY